MVASRSGLAHHKQPFAHDAAPAGDLLAAVEALRPTALIGVSGQPMAFHEQVIAAMTRHNQRPIVFALSNPTSKAECTARQAYEWSDGRAVFASGSPFDPVEYRGRTFVPGQGNNAYVFPGIGLGIVATAARMVPDEIFLVAARTLAAITSANDLATGCLYPPLAQIQQVSLAIAEAVAEFVFEAGLTELERPDDLGAHVRSFLWKPDYPEYLTES